MYRWRCKLYQFLHVKSSGKISKLPHALLSLPAQLWSHLYGPRFQAFQCETLPRLQDKHGTMPIHVGKSDSVLTSEQTCDSAIPPYVTWKCFKTLHCTDLSNWTVSACCAVLWRYLPSCQGRIKWLWPGQCPSSPTNRLSGTRPHHWRHSSSVPAGTWNIFTVLLNEDSWFCSVMFCSVCTNGCSKLTRSKTASSSVCQLYSKQSVQYVIPRYVTSAVDALGP